MPSDNLRANRSAARETAFSTAPGAATVFGRPLFAASVPGGCSMHNFGWEDDVRGLDVLHAEFSVTTGGGAEHDIHDEIVPVLRRIRDAMGLEIVYIAQLLDGTPCPRAARGSAHIDETEMGAMVLGIPPASCLAVPVVGKSGREYGTVCCDRRTVTRRVDVGDALRSVSRMTGLLMDRGVNALLRDDVWESSAAAPLGLD